MAEIIKISDFNAPELDPFARLTERELFHSLPVDNGLFIAESPNVIHRALDAGYKRDSLRADLASGHLSHAVPTNGISADKRRSLRDGAKA